MERLELTETQKEVHTKVVMGLYEIITSNGMKLKFGNSTKVNGKVLTLALSQLDTNTPEEIIELATELINNK